MYNSWHYTFKTESEKSILPRREMSTVGPVSWAPVHDDSVAFFHQGPKMEKFLCSWQATIIISASTRISVNLSQTVISLSACLRQLITETIQLKSTIPFWYGSKTFPQPVSRRVLWQAGKDPVQTAPSIGSHFKATSQVSNMDKRDSPFLQKEQNAPEWLSLR